MRKNREPMPLRNESARSSGSVSAGTDCHTRSDSWPSFCHRPAAPSQPSLSWTHVTPRAFASFTPARIASTYSASGILRYRSLKRQAASSRSTPVGSPFVSRSTTPPSTSRSPPASASAEELSQSEW